MKGSYVDAAKKGYKYLSDLADHTNDVASAVDGLKDSLEYAVEAADALADAISNIPDPPSASDFGGGGYDDWGGDYYDDAQEVWPSSSSSGSSTITPTAINSADKRSISRSSAGADSANNPYSAAAARQAHLLEKKLNSHGGFATGGYTGEWHSSEGRVAVLHEKELVLNKEDTKNMLSAVGIVRSMNNLLNNISGNFILPNILSSFSSINSSSSSKLDQNVHIDAHFPNVSSHSEIEKAFDNLLNHASQFINR